MAGASSWELVDVDKGDVSLEGKISEGQLSFSWPSITCIFAPSTLPPLGPRPPHHRQLPSPRTST